MAVCSNGIAFCVLAWLICACSWLGVLPWTVYRFRQLWIRRNVQILWVRRLHLDLVPISTLLFQICVSLCLFLLRGVAGASLGNLAALRLVITTTLLALTVSIVYRASITLVDLRFAYITRELSWKSLIITEGLSQNELAQSKFFLWRKTWLSPEYMAAMLGVYGVIGLVIFMIEFFIGLEVYFGVTNSIFILMLVAGMVYMWYHTPSIIDTFGIRNEIRIFTQIGACTVVIFVSLFIILWLVGLLETPFHYLCECILFWITVVICLYVFTEHRFQLLSDSVKEWNFRTAREVQRSHVKAIRQSEAVEEKLSFGNALNPPSNANETSSAEPSGSLSPSSPGAVQSPQATFARRSRVISVTVMRENDQGFGQVDLNQTNSDPQEKQHPRKLITKRLFKHTDCIAVFADFLFKEISIENLIGFIEFYQLSVALSNKIDDTDAVILADFSLNTEIVPISTINECSDVSKRFMLLCDKYIGDHSNYRLNLPFTLVQKVERLLRQIEIDENNNPISDQQSEEDLDEMLRLCIGVVRECIGLLSDSFTRFKDHFSFAEFLKVEID